MNRHTICIWLLVIAAFGVPAANASPITYTINFTLGGGGTLPSAGSFAYDSGTHTFSAFSVTWEGIAFDLTGSANAPVTAGSPCGALTGGAASFALLSGACALDTVDWFSHKLPSPEFAFTTFVDPTNSILIWANAGSPTPPYDTSGGNWTLSAGGTGGGGGGGGSAVPEPTSLTLMVSGLFSGAVVARKRFLGLASRIVRS
jgi:hypothetical protein